MLNSQNILDTFVKSFNKQKNLNIVLYGLGGNTGYLLSNLKDYNFVGIMDSEREGEIYWGLPVLSVEQAKKTADLVIIVARESVIKIIYNRITDLDNYGIPVFDISGKRIKDYISNHETNDCSYWNKNIEDIKHNITKFDTISFDLFDTILMRKVLRPSSIFQVVEKELKDDCRSVMGFAQLRMDCEDELNKEGDVPTIYDIYERIKEKTGLDDNKIRHILELEYKTEVQYTCPRNDIIECMKHAVSLGKRVIIISDMYFTKQQLTEMLDYHNIKCYDALYVSCEYKKTKSSGDLYYIISECERKKMLHIGDDELSDVINAQKAGCEAYNIWSTYQILLNSNLNCILSGVRTLDDNRLIGRLMSNLLNSPFALNKCRGKIYFGNYADMAAICFAPYYLALVQWIVSLLSQRNERAFFLLGSRDGYLINRILDKLRNIGRLPSSFCKYEYFYISRRAVRVASIYNEEDILHILKDVHMTASFSYILNSYFGVDIHQDDPNKDVIIAGKADYDVLLGCMLPYYNDILYEAEKERGYYLKYITKSFNLNSYEQLYLYGLICQGSEAYYLSKMLHKNIHLICMATLNIPNDYWKNMDYIDSFLGNHDDYFTNHKAVQYFKMFEIVSSSMDNSLIKFDKYGQPHFNENVKFINKAMIDHFQEIIVNTIIEYVKNDDKWLDRTYSIEMCEAMFSVLESKYSMVDEGIKNIFIYESKEDNEPEHTIWNDIVY